MKNLSILTLAGLLATTSATVLNAAEINCATLPTCGSLGYTDKVSECTNVNEILRCPFDSTVGKCLHKMYEPSIGDLKYSLQSANHDGWLLCDGKQYLQSSYPKLYNMIQLQFCHKYTSRTDTSTTSNCKTSYFAVPDYRGFYLRGLNSSRSPSDTVGSNSDYYGSALQYKGDTDTVTSYNTPQYERLPDITGKIDIYGAEGKFSNASGAFTKTTYDNLYTQHGKSGNSEPYSPTYTFNASKSNSIYDGTHITPAHYGAYIFIYAGK